ncbi:Glycosyltransferase involved in cell wall bisynthesis [Saccharicrinis carchari]|uniref:Glycosyltransferase involved in cell wall bisynthesis n=2 Tax=Saccharicrinis carchari TaxID=1168039 RepID=A0A521CEH9_SACCC|nr:Glycosyltransferase involved in cell wall bisynthesis [Saccharicrinis carchari]
MYQTKKVCLFTVSLANGGAEKSTAVLSKILVQKGYIVHIVSLTDDIKYTYSGKLLNFGLIKGNTLRSKARAFIKLRKYLKENNFDYIIDNRAHQLSFRELFYMYYLYRGIDFFYVIRSNDLSIYFPPIKMVSRLMINKAARIISVSKGIEMQIRTKFKTNNVQTIYNPIEETVPEQIPATENNGYILFLGRLEDDVKNISLLLSAYNASCIRNEVRVKIFGEGKDKAMLQYKIEENGIADFVKIYPFTNDIATQIVNARFLVLCSHFEGFPRALIESLALGVPVVSVNCRGTEEIVENEVNGLLVENYNHVALARAMERMYYDEELYARCQKNSKQSVSHLHGDKIVHQWTALLQSIKQK